MAVVVGLKQLEINIDKSSYILFGKKNKVTEIREFLMNNPLTFNGNVIKNFLTATLVTLNTVVTAFSHP